MSKSPFPGMDPFLEQDWLDVHSRLVTYMCDQLQEQLPRELCARMESRVLVEGRIAETSYEPDTLRERRPDVRVVETSGSGGGVAVLEAPPIAEIEPDLFLVGLRRQPATQRYIEIFDSQTRGRVITTIELISPTNKLPGIGQRLYLAKREECQEANVNFVEIDLTRAGNRLAILPDLDQIHPLPTYVACVYRATRPDATAVYLMPLEKRLRSIRIPLRPADKDVVLHLQPLIEQAYERGRYGNLDYSRPLDPPLDAESAAFVEQMLKQAGKR